MVNSKQQVKSLSIRHAPVIPSDEHSSFPIKFLPKEQNENFYGRKQELEKISHHLDSGHNPTLRTYTLYGRRGVGKTDIALQYAHENLARYDAIFWVSCETSLALRQSFSDMAVELEIPGAGRNGQHYVGES
jgi:predicted AAA+ superfamily ATPase